MLIASSDAQSQSSEARKTFTYSGNTSANVTQPVVLTRKTCLSPRACLKCKSASKEIYPVLPSLHDLLIFALIIIVDRTIGVRPSPLSGLHLSHQQEMKNKLTGVNTKIG